MEEAMNKLITPLSARWVWAIDAGVPLSFLIWIEGKPKNIVQIISGNRSIPDYQQYLELVRFYVSARTALIAIIQGNENITYKRLKDINEVSDFKLPIPEEGDWPEFREQLREEWQTALQEQRRVLLSQFLPILEDLAQVEPVDSSYPYYTSIDVSGTFIIQEEGDALSTFRTAKNSDIIPYWRLNLSSQDRLVNFITRNYIDKLYKTYIGPPSKRLEPGQYIPDEETEKKNTLYGSLSIGKHYQVFQVDFEEETFHISKLPNVDGFGVDYFRHKLTEHLPELQLDQLTETKVRGRYTIYDFTFDEYLLADLIISDNLFRSFLYINENSIPLTLRNKFIIHHKEYLLTQNYEVTPIQEQNLRFSAFKATLSKDSLSVPREVRIGDRTVVYPENTELVHVSLSAYSRELAEAAVNILNRLFGAYSERAAERKAIYDRYGLAPEVPLEVSRIKKDIKVRGGLLAREFPQLFPPGYSRSCPNFPTIAPGPNTYPPDISPTITSNGLHIPRPILTLPNLENAHFVCPKDNLPYPGLADISKLANKYGYPYMYAPCCYASNRDDETDAILRRGLTVAPPPKKSKGAHRITTDRVLNSGQVAQLTEVVATYLSSVYKPDKDKYARIGLPNSINSLIHAYLSAIRYPEYMDANTDFDKEVIVSRLRARWAQTVNPSLLSQELYDITDEERREILADDTHYFDSQFFYRMLEVLDGDLQPVESTQMMVFIFALNTVKIKDSKQLISQIEVARYQNLPIRQKYDVPCILILKHGGEEGDNRSHPQYELIMYETKEGRDTIFPRSLTNQIYNAMLESNQVLSWNIIEEDLLARSNVYSLLHVTSYIPLPVTGQYIDIAGKARGFTFRVSREDKRRLKIKATGNSLTIITNPQQPLNISQLSGLPPNNNMELVKGLLGSPIAYSLEEGRVNGWWYSIADIRFGIFVPLDKELDKEEEGIIQGPLTPVIQPDGNISNTIASLNYQVQIVLQLVMWVFMLSKRSVNSFLRRYVQVNEEVESYDISSLSRWLPQVNSHRNAIRYITANTSRLIQDRKFQVPSNYYLESLRYYLSQYREHNPQDTDKIPEKLAGYYYTASQIERSNFSTVLLGTREWVLWLRDQRFIDTPTWKTKISPADRVITYPFVYFDDGLNSTFLVQNVENGDINRVWTVLVFWNAEKNNVGYNAEIYPDLIDQMKTVLSPYTILDIGASGNLFIAPQEIQDLHGGSRNISQSKALILRYVISRQDYRYAAIMKIL
jgi:hypothetical protein